MKKDKTAKANKVRTATSEVATATISKDKTSAKPSEKAKETEAPKEKVKRDAHSKNLLAIMPGLDTSLFISKARGGNKENIYHSHMFKNLTEKETKTLRRTLRGNLEKFTSSFAAYAEKKDKVMLAKLKVSFETYYKEVYRVNDFTVASILPANAGDEKKAEVGKMIKILKDIK